ncbi:MAG: heme ABC exporter ATP-binding protein CcmA [Burkholderiaceae bacterium]
MPDTLLSVSSLPVKRGRTTLAESLSFTLPAGSYIELYGANGSGKTTLLRTLARLQETASPGTISPDEASVFYFSHQSSFRPELRVADQLLLSLRMYGAEPDLHALSALLRRFGLAEKADLPIRQLSQGQTKRLMLALMAASKRPVWLMDEPLNALDEQALGLLHTLLMEHLDQGGAVVIATHRAMSEAIPGLAAYHAGIVQMGEADRNWQATAREPKSIPSARAVPATLAGWNTWQWVFRREWAIIASRPQDIAWPVVFHWMVVSIFPFGLSTEPELLQRIAAGVFWISVFFAMLVVATRLFEADFEHGALQQMKTAGIPLAALVGGKMLCSWLFIGVPLALVTAPLAMQYSLGGAALGVLCLSMAIGTLVLAGLACLFGALGLLARQAQVIINLLALPFFVPVLIFGTATVSAAQSDASAMAPLIVLAGMALLAVLTGPWAAARVLALALE